MFSSRTCLNKTTLEEVKQLIMSELAPAKVKLDDYTRRKSLKWTSRTISCRPNNYGGQTLKATSEF